eukprot:1160211-Pelagomonas_calceolata.AAC.2
MAMYQGRVYVLVDGDKMPGEVAPNKGLKQGCPLSPLLYTLYTNDMARFGMLDEGLLQPRTQPKCPNVIMQMTH